MVLGHGCCDHPPPRWLKCTLSYPSGVRKKRNSPSTFGRHADVLTFIQHSCRSIFRDALAMHHLHSTRGSLATKSSCPPVNTNPQSPNLDELFSLFLVFFLFGRFKKRAWNYSIPVLLLIRSGPGQLYSIPFFFLLLRSGPD